MVNVKLTAKFLYYLTRLMAIVYACVFLYAVLALLGLTDSLKIDQLSKQFVILIPFTEIPFLIGFYNTKSIFIDFLPTFLIYIIFFVLLGEVFKVFTKKKLFTVKNYGQLRLFYLGNFLGSILIPVVSMIASDTSFDAWLIVYLHLLLGVFIYFMAAIFKSGLNIQNEQDLII